MLTNFHLHVNYYRILFSHPNGAVADEVALKHSESNQFTMVFTVFVETTQYFAKFVHNKHQQKSPALQRSLIKIGLNNHHLVGVCLHQHSIEGYLFANVFHELRIKRGTVSRCLDVRAKNCLGHYRGSPQKICSCSKKRCLKKIYSITSRIGKKTHLLQVSLL